MRENIFFAVTPLGMPPTRYTFRVLMDGLPVWQEDAPAWQAEAAYRRMVVKARELEDQDQLCSA